MKNRWHSPALALASSGASFSSRNSLPHRVCLGWDVASLQRLHARFVHEAPHLALAQHRAGEFPHLGHGLPCRPGRVLPEKCFQSDPVPRQHGAEALVLEAPERLQPASVVQLDVVLGRVAVDTADGHNRFSSIALACPIDCVHPLSDGFYRIVDSFVI